MNKELDLPYLMSLWHRQRYNGIFNEWAQKYNIVRVKSNYISFHDNTEKDSIEVLVKNY
jgi:DNA adenine methylase